MIMRLFLLFAAGIIIDLLVTVYTKSVADRKIWSATLLSGIITFVSFILFLSIIKSLDIISDIIAYATGNCIGTYAGMIKHNYHKITEG